MLVISNEKCDRGCISAAFEAVKTAIFSEFQARPVTGPVKVPARW